MSVQDVPRNVEPAKQNAAAAASELPASELVTVQNSRRILVAGLWVAWDSLCKTGFLNHWNIIIQNGGGGILYVTFASIPSNLSKKTLVGVKLLLKSKMY